jgi:hypothetical protein
MLMFSNGGPSVSAATPGSLTLLHRKSIIALAADHRLPAVYPYRYHVADGGLISYGPDTIDQYRRAADPDRPPNTVPRHRWRQFVDDCKNFLSSSEDWADRAAILGWDAMALFGCAPNRPLDYFGSAGLLWAINGGRLVELHRDGAVIDVPVHGSKRIFSRRNVDPAKITLPWAKPTRPPGAVGRQGSRKLGGS